MQSEKLGVPSPVNLSVVGMKRLNSLLWPVLSQYIITVICSLLPVPLIIGGNPFERSHLQSNNELFGIQIGSPGMVSIHPSGFGVKNLVLCGPSSCITVSTRVNTHVELVSHLLLCLSGVSSSLDLLLC